MLASSAQGLGFNPEHYAKKGGGKGTKEKQERGWEGRGGKRGGEREGGSLVR